MYNYIKRIVYDSFIYIHLNKGKVKLGEYEMALNKKSISDTKYKESIEEFLKYKIVNLNIRSNIHPNNLAFTCLDCRDFFQGVNHKISLLLESSDCAEINCKLNLNDVILLSIYSISIQFVYFEKMINYYRNLIRSFEGRIKSRKYKNMHISTSELDVMRNIVNLTKSIKNKTRADFCKYNIVRHSLCVDYAYYCINTEKQCTSAATYRKQIVESLEDMYYCICNVGSLRQSFKEKLSAYILQVPNHRNKIFEYLDKEFYTRKVS